MVTDSRLRKLAYLLVNYSVGVQEKQTVRLSGTTNSEPLLRELYQEVIKAGGYPRVTMQFPDQDYLFYKLGQDHQINHLDPIDLYEMENIDALIVIFLDLNPHNLTSIDSEKKQKHILAKKKLSETVFQRWGSGELNWVGTAFPSSALAQEARMANDEYKEFLFSCMHLNEENPIQYWQNFSNWQQQICDRLNSVKQMQYIGQDTDLSFRCEGRKWINCDGKVNFPDGEVFTSPVEDSVNGTIRFTYPGIYQGEEVEDILLRFENGRIVEAKAKKGEKLLHDLIEIDEGARYVGEIAIGTNTQIDKFTKNMLLDEKMGHTIHLAIGRGMPESGSRNNSAIHWDMLKDMRGGGKIFADGKLIYKDGAFTT